MEDWALRYELLKLMLQLAWADHEIQPEERTLIETYALTLGLPEREERILLDFLAGRAPLPPPDLGLLRFERELALLVAKNTIRTDLKIFPEEAQLLALLHQLLEEHPD